MPSEKPSIIFGMPSVFGLADVIEEALQLSEFHVISLPRLSSNSKRYPSAAAWAYAKYRKLICHDKEAAKTMKGKVLQQELQRQLGGRPADYALFISGDIYSPELLSFVRQHSKHGSVNYQFDGLTRFPEIRTRQALFDRFYVFDPKDIAADGSTRLSHNFYFPHLLHNLPTPQYDCYFTGTHHPSRSRQINAFAELASQLNLKLDFTIVGKNIREHYHEHVAVSTQAQSFRQNLASAAHSHILADFVVGDHQGLSFRTFEALGMKKKLITTNASVQQYDFYHPDNILIFNEQTDVDTLRVFLDRPYHQLPSEMVEKYSFHHWLNRVLSLEKDHEKNEA